jgi:hypothetical protein
MNFLSSLKIHFKIKKQNSLTLAGPLGTHLPTLTRARLAAPSRRRSYACSQPPPALCSLSHPHLSLAARPHSSSLSLPASLPNPERRQGARRSTRQASPAPATPALRIPMRDPRAQPTPTRPAEDADLAPKPGAAARCPKPRVRSSTALMELQSRPLFSLRYGVQGIRFFFPHYRHRWPLKMPTVLLSLADSPSPLPLSIKGTRRPLLTSSPTRAHSHFLTLSRSPLLPEFAVVAGVRRSSPELAPPEPARRRGPLPASLATDLLAKPSPFPCASENPRWKTTPN